MIKELEIIVKEFTTHEGKKFNGYKTTRKTDGRLVDVKFTRAVKNLPEKNCWIKVEDSDLSYDKNRKFPCLWVRNILEVFEKTYERTEDDLPF